MEVHSVDYGRRHFTFRRSPSSQLGGIQCLGTPVESVGTS
jgi:hypothetical protein